MFAPEVLSDLAVVLLVRELNVLEQEASHGELKLVGLHNLLLNLLAKLGQIISALSSCLINVSMPECTLFPPACKSRRGATRKNRIVIVLTCCMTLNPTDVLSCELG